MSSEELLPRQAADTVKHHLDFASDAKEEKGTAPEMFKWHRI